MSTFSMKNYFYGGEIQKKLRAKNHYLKNIFDFSIKQNLYRPAFSMQILEIEDLRKK